jgi:hypothetical protein
MDGGSGVDRLLYDGEEVTLRAGGPEAGVVVTSHRVIALTPGVEGANYRPVERPNVTGLRHGTSGREGWLLAGLKSLFVGLALLVGGSVVDLDGVLATVEVGSTAANTGLGGLLRAVSLVGTALSLLDEVLLVAGALATLVGIGAVGAYLLTRERLVYLEVAGDEDVSLPAGALSEAEFSRLSGALSEDPPVAVASVDRS